MGGVESSSLPAVVEYGGRKNAGNFSKSADIHFGINVRKQQP